LTQRKHLASVFNTVWSQTGSVNVTLLFAHCASEI